MGLGGLDGRPRRRSRSGPRRTVAVRRAPRRSTTGSAIDGRARATGCRRGRRPPARSLRRLDLPRARATWRRAGTGSALVGTPSEIGPTRRPSRPPSPTSSAATPARSRQAPGRRRLGRAGRARAMPTTPRQRRAAIDDGTLPGVVDLGGRRVAVATADGVTFVDPARGAVVTTVPLDGGAHGLALVTGLDDPKLYATVGAAERPGVRRRSPSAATARRTARSRARAYPLPGPGTRVVYDERHAAGPHPGPGPGDRTAADRGRSTSSSRTATRSTPTRGCPTASSPIGLGRPTSSPTYPAEDRQAAPRSSTAAGATASIEVGLARLRVAAARASSPARSRPACCTCWPGSCSGAGSWPASSACSSLVDGMFFVQSRIGMNDVYVGPVHRRGLHGLRGPLDRLVARPGRVLAGDAGDRRSCWAWRWPQVGRGLRHRGAGPAHPRPQRARARPGDPRPHRHHRACSATWRSACPDGQHGLRQPHVPADHGRA